jgi:hypothetical protein
MNWWETDFVAVRGNKLLVAGRDAAALAERYGTPLYIYGKDRILERYARLDDALTRHSPLPSRICYAMKANSHRGSSACSSGGAPGSTPSPARSNGLKAGFRRSASSSRDEVSRADLRSVFAVDG